MQGSMVKCQKSVKTAKNILECQCLPSQFVKFLETELESIGTKYSGNVSFKDDNDQDDDQDNELE